LDPAAPIDLHALEEGMPGISPRWGAFLAEASAVCLNHHNHPPGVLLRVTGLLDQYVPLTWAIAVNKQLLNSWNDQQELAEYGACGVAILAVLRFEGHKVIRRARKGSKVDYWLASANAEMPFQDAARLEVSGILNGSEAEATRRVREKVSQVQQAPGTLPTYVVVVEFSAPQSHMVSP